MAVDMMALGAFELFFILVLLFILIRVGRIFFALDDNIEPPVSPPSQSPASENSPISVAEVVPDNARAEPQELLHDDELNTMQLNVNPEK